MNMSGEMEDLRNELEMVREDIQKVEQEIEGVKKEIVSVELKLNEQGLSAEDTTYWRTEKLQLMEEENLLRQEENLLLDKDKQLRDEKNRLLKKESAKRERPWCLVTGNIEIDKAAAGSRRVLFKLAGGGYYPKGMEPNAALAIEKHPTETTKRLLSISVVFSDELSAISFIVKVDKYIDSTRGVDYRNGIKFSTKQEEPKQVDNSTDRLVLGTDYVPNQAYGEPPQDLPVGDVEVSAMDTSALSQTSWDVEVRTMDASTHSPATIYSRSDTVFKYQRIEADAAFARGAPSGAHIFPRAKCEGRFEWLDKATFNRLALSADGHSNFDGHSRGVHAATSPLVALEPFTTSDIMLDHATFTRISNRLWCRSKSLANGWRPYLNAEVQIGNEGEHQYFEPIYIYCERQRTVALRFEQQKESDGTFENVCVTAIPGVDDPRKLSTWNDLEGTVAVSEVMVCLLRWHYAETRRIWAETA